MKTHTAFDPARLTNDYPFALVSEYLQNQYYTAADAAYGIRFVVLREAFAQQFQFTTGIEDMGECQFAYSAERNVGFWLPVRADTFKVEMLGNGYQNPAMDRATLGAAASLLTVNHYGWHLAENASPGSERYMLAEAMSDNYLSLRDWVFDLSEQGLLDGEAIAGFID